MCMAIFQPWCVCSNILTSKVFNENTWKHHYAVNTEIFFTAHTIFSRNALELNKQNPKSITRNNLIFYQFSLYYWWLISTRLDFKIFLWHIRNEIKTCFNFFFISFHLFLFIIILLRHCSVANSCIYRWIFNKKN